MPEQPKGRASETEPPRARLRALPSERRARLLDPAEQEFAEFGFAEASLNRILAQAGMSKGQAYYYISGKADLYSVVIERALERLTEKMDFSFGRPTGPDEFWGRVQALLTRLTMALLEDDRLASLGRGMYESELTRAALDGTLEGIRRRLADLVELGQCVGAVRTDLPQTLLIDVLFAMGLEMDRWFSSHFAELAPQEALRLNQTMLSMIRSAAGPVVPPPR